MSRRQVERYMKHKRIEMRAGTRWVEWPESGYNAIVSEVTGNERRSYGRLLAAVIVIVIVIVIAIVIGGAL